jgi:glycosyltransferase involved in cell wall biosynthesis
MPVSSTPQVLHLIHGLTVGGAEVDLLQKCRVLIEQHGYQFTVACLMRRGELATRFESLGINVIGPLMHGRYDLAAGLAVRRLLAEHPAPILHTHLAAANLIGWLVNGSLPRRQRKMQLAGEHAMAERWPRPVLWLDRQMTHSAQLLVPTAATRASYIARGLSPAAVHILPDSLEVSRFSGVDRAQARARVRVELGIAEEETVVGTLCRLEPVKNLPQLIEAVAPLPVRLLIAGEGSERAHLQAEISRQGLAGKVLLLGNRNDAPAVLAALDLFVLSSHSETFGMAVAEALLMERPTVATRVGGIPDITGDGAYARLVPPGDSAALRTAIVETLADRARAQAQARQGRAFVRNAFASEVVAEQLHTVYAQAFS